MFICFRWTKVLKCKITSTCMKGRVGTSNHFYISWTIRNHVFMLCLWDIILLHVVNNKNIHDQWFYYIVCLKLINQEKWFINQMTHLISKLTRNLQRLYIFKIESDVPTNKPGVLLQIQFPGVVYHMLLVVVLQWWR